MLLRRKKLLVDLALPSRRQFHYFHQTMKVEIVFFRYITVCNVCFLLNIDCCVMLQSLILLVPCCYWHWIPTLTKVRVFLRTWDYVNILKAKSYELIYGVSPFRSSLMPTNTTECLWLLLWRCMKHCVLSMKYNEELLINYYLRWDCFKEIEVASLGGFFYADTIKYINKI